MSTAKPVPVPNLPSDASILGALEDGFYPAFQRLLAIHFRNLTVIAETLSDPDIAATTQKLLGAFKMQQDSVVANISESLSLIDEMWLLLQAQHERQFASHGDAARQSERPVAGSKSSVDH